MSTTCPALRLAFALDRAAIQPVMFCWSTLKTDILCPSVTCFLRPSPRKVLRQQNKCILLCPKRQPTDSHVHSPLSQASEPFVKNLRPISRRSHGWRRKCFFQPRQQRHC